MSSERPLVALTLGDVAGIGPEVVVRAWSDARLLLTARPFVVGRTSILQRAARLLGAPVHIAQIHSTAEAAPDHETIPCLNFASGDLDNVRPGTVDATAGRAAHDFLVAAADFALAGQVDAITTLPLNKESLRAAGVTHPGHTEILAERCGVKQHAMMLYVAPPIARRPGGLGVAHATLHVALADALKQLSSDAIEQTILLADSSMRTFVDRSNPRIAVAGLNPHAGEHGLFGTEEDRLILPAIKRAREHGLDVSGPIAADTLFYRAFDGEFDAVVAMYHDQGHVAVKSRAFWEAVNITLGLPIIRTSVAHGTAFDIAWQGKAKGDSLVEAVRVAARLATTTAQRLH